MIVLGIHDGHNAAAALLVDGQVRAAIQEERLSRVKNDTCFPQKAIAWVLKDAGVDLRDVDVVAMHSTHVPFPKSREQLMEQVRLSSSVRTRVKRLVKSTKAREAQRALRRMQRMRALMALGVPEHKVRFVDHHTAHAAVAYYGSSFSRNEDVLVLTCDGAGDDLCASVSIGRGGQLKRIAQIDEEHSLGNVYAMITFLMGMVPLEHEYKLMGLAPYAEKKGTAQSHKVFSELVSFDPANPMLWRRNAGVPNFYYCLDYLQERLAFHRFDWIAAGLQQWAEETLTTWARACILKTGVKKVALGGGVFMNVKANKAIMELPELEALFVAPSCGDETNAIGAAYKVFADAGLGAKIPPLRDLYWGPEPTNADIERALEAAAPNGFSVRRVEDVDAKVGEMLAAGEVVARCSGRMEFGARALGNRSLLAHPANMQVVRLINEMIKSRDFWMPFASSVLAEREHDYLKNPKKVASPYMIMSYDTTPRVDEIRAGTHPYDETVRPQIVERDWNPSYHRIIKEFERRTGTGAVLNTSFNLHGFPVVCSAADGVEVFLKSGLKHLVMGNYLASKNS